MSTPSPAFRKQLRAAEAHLSAASPVLAELIAHVGRCTLNPDPDIFRVLVRSLVAQFISTHAAKSINGRLDAKLKGKVTPARLLKLTDDELRGCGVSGGKAKAVRGAAEHFRKTRRCAEQLALADDAAARAMLLPLHGVGPWTVDMLMIFSLARLDVWPVGDFAVRAGVRDVLRLPDVPGPKELVRLAEPWRPYRSVAAWYLWRSRGFVPQSGMDDPSEPEA
jgi:DNA-3-methyladenine glycosylase II